MRKFSPMLQGDWPLACVTLEPLCFLVHINDLSNGLNSNPKLFADDTSLFSVIHDVNSSQIDLNENLDKIND